MTQPLSMAELLRRVVESQRSDLHTALPGIVRSYDASSQTAEVELALTRPLPAEDENDEEDTFETLPVLPSVPVAWPRGGGFYFHCPLTDGDSVLVVFCESDTNAWRNSGGVSDPSVTLRHTLSGPVAIPGLYPRNDTLADADGSNATFGSDGGLKVTVTSSALEVDGNSDAAALASKVDDLQSNLNDLITAYNNHIHTTTATVGTGPVGVISPTTSTGTPSAETFDSQVLKVGS